MPNKWIAHILVATSFAAATGACNSSISEVHRERSATPTKAAEVAVAPIQELQLKKIIEIPGELKAFQNVAIEAKVEGYISWIGVDRGSRVKRNDKILTIFCPELEEHEQEEESKYSSAVSSLRKGEAALNSTKSKLLEAEARLDADSLTLNRLNQTMAKMPGSVALNDIDVQTKTVDSDKARVGSMTSEVTSSEAVVASDKSNVAAAMNVVKSVRSLQSYLTIRAPFNGMITERNVHVGSMVGPQDNKVDPLVRIQERDTLRLVVAVPEDSIAGLKPGQIVAFRVPTFLGEDFHGVVARPAYAIDMSTRTMPVELSVSNTAGRLEPGMFATVRWPISRPSKTLFVPATAVATDLKGTFINLIKDGAAHRIEVQKGQSMGDMIEIVGDVKTGDNVALTATDELKSGTRVVAKVVTPQSTKSD